MRIRLHPFIEPLWSSDTEIQSVQGVPYLLWDGSRPGYGPLAQKVWVGYLRGRFVHQVVS